MKRQCNYQDCANANKGNSSWLWKLLTLLGFMALGMMALLNLCLKKKNDEYRDALIDMSEQIPYEDEGEEDEQRRKEWHSAHAPFNRKTVEERLADQRVQEA